MSFVSKYVCKLEIRNYHSDLTNTLLIPDYFLGKKSLMSGNPYKAICQDDIHCLASALIVTIVLITFSFIGAAIVYKFRYKIFFCLEAPPEGIHESRLDLTDIGNFLVQQGNARVSAKFIGRNTELHISSQGNESEANLLDN